MSTALRWTAPSRRCSRSPDKPKSERYRRAYFAGIGRSHTAARKLSSIARAPRGNAAAFLQAGPPRSPNRAYGLMARTVLENAADAVGVVREPRNSIFRGCVFDDEWRRYR